MSNAGIDIVFEGVKQQDGTFEYYKVGTVVKIADRLWAAYNLSDIEVYCGDSFNQACGTLRGEC